MRSSERSDSCRLGVWLVHGPTRSTVRVVIVTVTELSETTMCEHHLPSTRRRGRSRRGPGRFVPPEAGLEPALQRGDHVRGHRELPRGTCSRRTAVPTLTSRPPPPDPSGCCSSRGPASLHWVPIRGPYCSQVLERLGRRARADQWRSRSVVDPPTGGQYFTAGSTRSGTPPRARVRVLPVVGGDHLRVCGRVAYGIVRRRHCPLATLSISRRISIIASTTESSSTRSSDSVGSTMSVPATGKRHRGRVETVVDQRLPSST